jgi:hypothetical protein
VQGIQRKHGKDKLEVLLLSVDASYGQPADQAAEGDRSTMNQHGITWPNVVVPNGWDEVIERFNIDGYGLTLIDNKGKVVAKDVRHGDLDRLLQQMYRK